MISISGLKKIAGGRTILDIGELELLRGGRYALLGLNGSGKTTLLRVLAGLLPCDQGRLTGLGRSFCYLPQKPYAFRITVEKSMALALPEGTSREEIGRALALLGMESFAKTRCSELSGGEAQRVALARLLLRPCELLLLDEPTSAADIAGCELALDAIKKYCDRTGCTMVFATHSPPQAKRLAQEAILLSDGKIAEQGGANQVLNDPRSAFGRLFMQHWRI